MTSITFRSDFDVQLVGHMASDLDVVKAARVSTTGADAEGLYLDNAGAERFIDFLMRGRHGSPFEHCVFRFMITAPIFVWREFMRHRIASYNEESGRYKKLEPVFYIPPAMRNLQQVGKPGEYQFVPGNDDQISFTQDGHKDVAEFAYENYERLLQMGVAREVARMTLPVSIYSSAYVTINARSLMNFLSLRVGDPEAAFPSTPQWEIEQVAKLMEKEFAYLMPITHRVFNARGRVQP